MTIEGQRKVGSVTFDAHWTLASNYWNYQNLENPYAPLFWERDPNTVRQRVVLNSIWQLPFGKGKRYMSNAHPVVDQLLGGWQVYWIASMETGQFFGPTFSGADPSNTNTTSGQTRSAGRMGIFHPINGASPVVRSDRVRAAYTWTLRQFRHQHSWRPRLHKHDVTLSKDVSDQGAPAVYVYGGSTEHSQSPEFQQPGGKHQCHQRRCCEQHAGICSLPGRSCLEGASRFN